ncbi:MAG: hypothetical protein ACOYOV_14395, partial [Bacteroidales bacterium]
MKKIISHKVKLISLALLLYSTLSLGNNIDRLVHTYSTNSPSAIRSITVSDLKLDAPVAVCNNIDVYIDASGNYVLTAADIAAVGAGSTGGTLSVWPSVFNCSNLGPITVTLTVDDGIGNIATCDAVITVKDIEKPIFTFCPVDQLLTNDADLCSYTNLSDGFNALASDNCAVVSLSYSLTGATAGAGSTLNGVTFNKGITTVIWTAADASGNSEVCIFTVEVIDIEQPQNVICKPVTFNLDINGSITVYPVNISNSIPTDNCGFTQAFISKVAGGMDPFITYNCNDIGKLNKAYLLVTDGSDNGTYCVSTITIKDNTPPSITTCPVDRDINGCSISDITNPVYSAVTTNSSFAVFSNSTNLGAGSDNCGVTTVQYRDVIQAGTNCPIIVRRTWTLKDATGNTSATCIQTIHVHDLVPPVFAALPGLTTIYCPAIPVFTIASAIDACGNAFTLTYADITTHGLCAGTYSVTRTWTATDICGNSSTKSQTINVLDTSAPVISALPDPTTINCPSLPSFTQAIATDACGSAITLTFADVTTPGSCAGSYSITRTWTATDACGNSSTGSQTINVQ